MALDALPDGPPQLRRHWLVGALREAIATGELRPGDRLIERDISGRTGVSRGPVREALLLLEQEGLVVSHSYRGARVASVSREEAEQMLLPMRVVLEQFAFRHALPHLTDADFEELERLVADMHRAAEAGDARGVVNADVRFHEYLIGRSGWPHCEQVWRTIVSRVRAYFYDDAPRHSSLDDVTLQHRALIDALRTKDEQTVMDAVVEHIRERPTFGGPRSSA